MRVPRARWALVVIAWCLSACFDGGLVPCGDRACPYGYVCTPGGCAAPGDVEACEGLDEGAECRSTTGAAGTCQGGSCRVGLCGNGMTDIGEVCDDGNQASGDGCRGDCAKVEACGDGVADLNEACDDGNQNPADGCDACATTTWQATAVVGAAMGAAGAALANPSGVAADGLGRLYIADTNAHRIRRVEVDGSITTIAGVGTPGYSGDGGAATSAQLSSPSGVAVDGIGRVFVADTENHRVRRIELDGTITTVAGTGAGGYGGDGGAAILARVRRPQAVAVDGLGLVFVADTENHRIRRIDVDGTIDTIAGTGVEGYGGDNGPATSAQLALPSGVAVADDRTVLIADTNNQRIRAVDESGEIRTAAGNGNVGNAGDGGPATSARLSFPIGVAAGAGTTFYIADTLNQRVRRVAGGTIDAFAGTGVQGYAGDGGPADTAELSNPFGVAFDGVGRVAIADTFNHRIRVVDETGLIATAAGTGMFGAGGDGKAATSAQLGGPFGVVIDGSGRIVFADTFNNRIRRIEADGTLATLAGTGLQGYSGDNGPATSAMLYQPCYVAIDALGRVVFSDTFNFRIRRIETNGTITTVAGNGTFGYGGDNGPATSARLANPNGVAIDQQGGILVADTYNHRIRRIDPSGTITTIAGTGSFGSAGDGGPAAAAQVGYPYGVAVDAMNRILIGDTSNHKVRRIDTNGDIDTIAGTGIQGFGGDGGPATAARLDSPYGVGTDQMGRVLLADSFNNRIRRIELNGDIDTIAGSALAGAAGDAGPATMARLGEPLSVAADATGRVILADTNNNRIRRVDTTGVIATVAGKIDPDGVGPVADGRLDDPQALVVAGELALVAGGTSGTVEAIRGGRVEVIAGRYPQEVATGNLARYRTSSFGSVGGVAIDPATGLIYLTETSANRLHVVAQVDPQAPDTWTIATLANAAGTAGSTDGAAVTARFRAPTGLYFDAATRTLYIADTGNHAIRALALDTDTVTTVVNTSHGLGYAGDGGPALGARLYAPTAMTRCGNGDLFIADTSNNRVRRVAAGVITTVLGDGVPASSGEGSPSHTFPVDAPRGLACDALGNLFVTSTAAVRLLPATDAGLVDGDGAVSTIYGAPPRATFPSSHTSCLSGLAATGTTTVDLTDACTGLLVRLQRAAAP